MFSHVIKKEKTIKVYDIGTSVINNDWEYPPIFSSHFINANYQA